MMHLFLQCTPPFSFITIFKFTLFALILLTYMSIIINTINTFYIALKIQLISDGNNYYIHFTNVFMSHNERDVTVAGVIDYNF